MRTTTKRIRLRIDLALASPDDPRPSRRRRPLTPPADSVPGRARSTLLVPGGDGPAPLTAPAARTD
jgi:hypothetical protein